MGKCEKGYRNAVMPGSKGLPTSLRPGQGMPASMSNRATVVHQNKRRNLRAGAPLLFAPGIANMDQNNGYNHNCTMLYNPEAGYNIFHEAALSHSCKPTFEVHQSQAQKQLDISADKQIESGALVSIGKGFFAVVATQGSKNSEQQKQEQQPAEQIVRVLKTRYHGRKDG